MNQETEVIGINSECSNLIFESNYVPLISFKSQVQKDAAEKYIMQHASNFLTNILKINIPVTQLAYPKIITEQDFKKVDISYFYENLFHDLGERNFNGKLELKIKWGITFDEKCAPIQVGWISQKFNGSQNEARPSYTDYQGRPHRRYGTIDINGTPIFYYIHFTLQEILDVIKQTPEIKIN